MLGLLSPRAAVRRNKPTTRVVVEARGFVRASSLTRGALAGVNVACPAHLVISACARTCGSTHVDGQLASIPANLKLSLGKITLLSVDDPRTMIHSFATAGFGVHYDEFDLGRPVLHLPPNLKRQLRASPTNVFPLRFRLFDADDSAWPARGCLGDFSLADFPTHPVGSGHFQGEHDEMVWEVRDADAPGGVLAVVLEHIKQVH